MIRFLLIAFQLPSNPNTKLSHKVFMDDLRKLMGGNNKLITEQNKIVALLKRYEASVLEKPFLRKVKWKSVGGSIYQKNFSTSVIKNFYFLIILKFS